MRYQLFHQFVIGIAKRHGRELLIEHIQASAGIGPRSRSVPHATKVLKLWFVPERTIFHVERRGAGAFTYSDKAAACQKFGEQFDTMLVDSSPVYIASRFALTDD